jgi:F-type H+-transporting ATPase subunit delta
MKISRQARREAKELFRSCVANGLLDENRVRQAVVQVLNAKPRGYMAILNRFQRLVKLDLERRSARIESVLPMNESMRAAVQNSLEQRYGRGLNFRFMQNPDLLGGVRVQVGSDVYDGSIRARLTELEQAFATS